LISKTRLAAKAGWWIDGLVDGRLSRACMQDLQLLSDFLTAKTAKKANGFISVRVFRVVR
jgi:hypothetical protein